MTRTKAIWESASVGRRDIVVYWKQTTFSGMCPALLRNHEGFLKDLARSEICDVSIGRPIAATDIARFCRQHDISTSGTLSYSCKGKTVHEWPLTVSGMRRESNMVVFSVDGTQRTRFEYRGFQISLAATGERLWWSIELVDQSKLQELSPWSLQDTAGFLLATVAVIDTTLVELFRFPTCGSRSEQLSGDAFLSSHYTVPTPHPPSWYHDDKRGKYVESVFLDFGLPGSDTPVDIVLLVEEKQDVVLSYNKAGDYRAERETDLYDPVSISW
jgi:hypothetical protein